MPVTLKTERDNPASANIDQMSTLDAVSLINREDAKVAAAVREALPQVAAAVDIIAAAIARGGRLIYLGAGTSGRLGVLDAVECAPTFSVGPDLVQGVIAGGVGALTNSIEGAEDKPDGAQGDLAARGLTEADVVCGIAASGRTPYVIGGLEYAKALGAKTIAIACNAGSAIGDIADVAIWVEVGPEIIAGSTRMKAGTAQKLILNMLSTAAMIRLGKVYGNLMVDVKVSNRKLAERACRLVMRLAEVDDEGARELLARANNEVKPAVVMSRLAVDFAEARRLLAKTDGRLRDVIGAEPG